MEFLSTSSLANVLNIPANQLFSQFKSLGWIDRKNDKWILTELGKQKGGQTKYNPKFGEFIVWPENISVTNNQDKEKSKLLNATAISKHFNVSSQRLNLILSELGWIEKDIAGWELTKLGKSVGGKQFEHESSGGLYVLWPDYIMKNNSLLDVFSENKKEGSLTKENLNNLNAPEVENKNVINFREKFEAKHRTKDGHYVRSKAEVIIDNTLYDYGLAHAYEKKLSIEEEVYTDFYLPNKKVYIEYWGLENDPKYAERKRKKIEIYKKYEMNLIELTDEDILNLDDHLPKKLLKFDIKVY